MSWMLIFAAIVVAQAEPNYKRQFEPFSDELIQYINEEVRSGQVDNQIGMTELEGILTVQDISSASAITDRICIHSNGQKKPRLSAIDIVSCCAYCGYGCNGGIPAMSWDYWTREGVVTGGTLENPTGCLPYPFPKCSHGVVTPGLPPCPRDIYPTPKCEKKCHAGYNKTYEQDKVKGKSSYNVGEQETDIMMEIMKNGPVDGIFYMFEDFLVYKSGIYHYTTGRLVGGHAIRVIGWGVENGVKYWLIANSWNEGWGEKGYFRMRRGNNECGIEARINAGLP